jgi:hypothetical protein
MSMDLVTPDNVSIEMIQEIYDAAMMEASLDEESQYIRIKEEVRAQATLSESKERIQLLAFYGIKEDAQRIDRLELANRVNENFAVVRAGINDEGDLSFDYSIILRGGVTRKAIVQATRVFLMLVPRAVNDCDEDGIVD